MWFTVRLNETKSFFKLEFIKRIIKAPWNCRHPIFADGKINSLFFVVVVVVVFAVNKVWGGLVLEMEWGSRFLAIEFVHSIETVVIWELNTLLGIFGYSISKMCVYINIYILPETRPSEFQLNCFCLSASHNKCFSTRHFYWFYAHWINHIHALWRPQSRVFFFFGVVIARETEKCVNERMS